MAATGARGSSPIPSAPRPCPTDDSSRGRLGNGRASSNPGTGGRARGRGWEQHVRLGRAPEQVSSFGIPRGTRGPGREGHPEGGEGPAPGTTRSAPPGGPLSGPVHPGQAGAGRGDHVGPRHLQGPTWGTGFRTLHDGHSSSHARGTAGAGNACGWVGTPRSHRWVRDSPRRTGGLPFGPPSVGLLFRGH